MEIEFNTGRIPSAGSSPSQPVAKKNAAAAAPDAVSFSNSDSLKEQLSNMSTVRPEAVTRAKQLVGSGKYPPDDVLDRIAVLLAMRMPPSYDSQSGKSS